MKEHTNACAHTHTHHITHVLLVSLDKYTGYWYKLFGRRGLEHYTLKSLDKKEHAIPRKSDALPGDSIAQEKAACKYKCVVSPNWDMLRRSQAGTNAAAQGAQMAGDGTRMKTV